MPSNVLESFLRLSCSTYRQLSHGPCQNRQSKSAASIRETKTTSVVMTNFARKFVVKHHIASSQILCPKTRNSCKNFLPRLRLPYAQSLCTTDTSFLQLFPNTIEAGDELILNPLRRWVCRRGYQRKEMNIGEYVFHCKFTSP